MNILKEVWRNLILRQFVIISALCLIVAAFFLAEYIIYINSPKKLRVVFFDAGFGNSVLVTTPLGKEILIDGGQRGLRGVWDYGATTIAPTFTKFQIAKLDMMVVTSIRPGNIGGLIYLTDYYPIKKIVLPLDPKVFNTSMGYIPFLDKLGDWQLLSNPYTPEACVLYLNYYDLLKCGVVPAGQVKTEPGAGNSIIKKLMEKETQLIPAIKPAEGEIIYEEIYRGKKLQLKALSPLKSPVTGTQDDIGNNSIVLKVIYGGTSLLIPSNIKREAELALISRWGKELKSDCMMAPSNGSPAASSPEFIKAVSPQIAIVSHGYLSRSLQVLDKYFYDSEMTNTLKEYKKRKIKTYHLEKTGAVTIRTDGSKFDIARDVRTVFGK